jgi:hypothetical protein
MQARRISISDFTLRFKINIFVISAVDKLWIKKNKYYFDFSFGIKYISIALRKCGIKRLPPGRSTSNIFAEFIRILANICLRNGFKQIVK